MVGHNLKYIDSSFLLACSTYEDICHMLEDEAAQKLCPPGRRCQCPIPAQHLHIKRVITAADLPSYVHKLKVNFIRYPADIWSDNNICT